MKNRKYFVALFLAVAFILTPVLATAQTPTIAELRAQIAALQRQLAILLGQQDNTGTWCHTFNTNLRIGMTGSEVTALQTALTRAGFSVNDSEGGNFNESTAAAVSGFQLRYRDEILAPLGLTAPTGYFGPSTRIILNRLYGCWNVRPPTSSPSEQPIVTRQTVFDVVDSVTRVSLGNVAVRVERTNGSLVATRSTGGDGETVGIPLTVGERYEATFTRSDYQLFSTSFTVPSGTGFYRISPVAMSRLTSTTPPPAPSITVSSPTNNQQWTSTNGPVIQWSSANIPSGNMITVELLTPSTGQVSGFSSFSTANDGSESGRLTNSTVASGWYYFRLSTVVNGQTIYGGSGVFQFTGVTPPLSTTYTLNLITAGTGSGLTSRSPNQTNYAAGTVVTITATPTNGSTFTGWSGSRISITNPVTVTMNGNLDIYANFTAATTPPTQPTISVTAPAAGATVQAGSSLFVAWTSSNLSSSATVKIQLKNSAGADVSIPINVNNTGSYQTVIPSTLAAGQYRYYLSTTLANGNSYGNTGPTFNVSAPTQPPATPSITVSSPSANSNWTAANGPVIQWSSVNVPSGNSITVELLTPSNGNVPGFSSFTTANDGSESGRLTNSSVASGSYYFRLSTVVNGQTIYGGSGVFQFTGASQPPTAVCGNGILDSGEQCDGSNFGGLSCATYNYSGGSLSCSASCTLSTSQCTNPPAAASITVSSPTASSRWTPTAFTHSVTWTSSNIPSSQYLTMELMTPANTRVNAFTPVSSVNDGSQAVNISNIAPGYYWFRLTATVNGQPVYGGSGVFQIVNN